MSRCLTPANIRGVYKMLMQTERGETKAGICFVTVWQASES